MNLPPVKKPKGKLIDTHTHTHSAHTIDCVVLWSLCTYLDKRHLLRDWKTNPCRVLQFYTHTHCWSGCSLSSCIPPAEGTIWSSTWGVWLATGSFNHCQHPIVRTLIMWCGISCCSFFNTPLYLHLFILSLWLQPRAHSVVWCVYESYEGRVESLLLNLSVRTRWYCFGPPRTKIWSRKDGCWDEGH